jgi:hypothetical protein
MTDYFWAVMLCAALMLVPVNLFGRILQVAAIPHLQQQMVCYTSGATITFTVLMLMG